MKAANTRRFHTVPIIGEQTVGHHSHRMCLLLRWLLDGNVPSQLYEAVLFHDLAESEYGDVPATAKWDSITLSRALDNLEYTWNNANGIYVPLSDLEQDFINIVDKLELVLYCTEQMMLGNQNMRNIRGKGIRYVRGILNDQAQLSERIYDKCEQFIEECLNECQ
jgi:5'-deoxynucleotidase YfbR-like HD superfamily hydrolase